LNPANAFIGKTEPPSEAERAEVLGPANPLWDRLLTDLADEFGLTVREWSSYSVKAGWSLRLKRDKRNILYLIPCRGAFFVSFILGDKAVESARRAGLPKPIQQVLDEARRYAEGRGIRIEMTGPGDISVVKKLTSAKLEN